MYIYRFIDIYVYIIIEQHTAATAAVAAAAAPRLAQTASPQPSQPGAPPFGPVGSPRLLPLLLLIYKCIYIYIHICIYTKLQVARFVRTIANKCFKIYSYIQKMTLNLIGTLKTSIYRPKHTKHAKTYFKLFEIHIFQKKKVSNISDVY